MIRLCRITLIIAAILLYLCSIPFAIFLFLIDALALLVSYGQLDLDLSDRFMWWLKRTFRQMGEYERSLAKDRLN